MNGRGRGAFAEELERIERFYTEQFLPANAWSTLRPHPYLYLRQRQRRMRETLLECGIDTPEKLRGLDILDVGSGGGTNLAWLIELGADFDGENRVMFASDWPHHDFDHPDKVLQIPLSLEGKRKIMSDNAMRFFDLAARL